ncbi:hypothetical protein TNCT_734381 [Trichonephila clavata]|uniref:Uncharacterized protein n=1 Tax=Trichonephila clavata TaxID=2740835 RepID=A0A8X6H176_TRICU|nr:hypothetical protein TNCT_734381 [Trichonephila clavata]
MPNTDILDPPLVQPKSFRTRVDALSCAWISDSGDNVIISFSISQLDRHLDTRTTSGGRSHPFPATPPFFLSRAIGGIKG